MASNGSTASPAGFAGFHPDALEFFDGLGADNSKSYWNDQRETYERSARGPMSAMLAELADEFGSAKIFRPYRDVRFSADKSPYKDHLGAFTGPSPTREGTGSGYYVQLSANGLYAGGGRYTFDRDALARYRAAVDNEHTGRPLTVIVADLVASGLDVGGASLVRAPRGFDPDHPRIDLLRHKGLHAGRLFTVDDWLFTAEAKDRVAATWRELTPLNAWFDTHLDGI